MLSTKPAGNLSLPCRYYRVYTDEDTPCEERNFQFVERTLSLPVHQSALVLVDVWSTCYLDSWMERATQITQGRIAPLLAAAREIGLTVIHAPSPQVADRYANAPEESASLPQANAASQWPPPKFRGIYRGDDFSEFGRNREPRLQSAIERYKTELDIAAAARPQPGELVIHTGAQMHELLAERKILHLFYAGFATNWCILRRDYGLVAMNDRGYNCILLRDATTGIEFHDSVESLTATRIAIREIETKYAWSAATDDFIAAAENLPAA